MADALRRLRDTTAADGTRLSVIVLPLLKPLAEWSPEELSRRSSITTILRDLGVRTFDLVPALEDAIARGLPLTETTGDVWHPSDPAAQAFAALLRDRGLLAP